LGLSIEEMERYSRQIPVIGVEGQLKLKNTTMLIVGLGGLGSIVSIYLAASGVGRLIIVDNESVELSNLQRQILYTTSDLGKPKAYVAKERLSMINPNVEIEAYNMVFDMDNGSELVKKADIVIDALDNWETRFILDKLVFKHGKPMVHAGVEGFYGQLTTIIPGKTPCLRYIFQSVKLSRRRVNVLATTPGVLGILEANEAIKLATGIGEVLANKILVYNGLRNEFTIIDLKPQQEYNEICYSF